MVAMEILDLDHSVTHCKHHRFRKSCKQSAKYWAVLSGQLCYKTWRRRRPSPPAISPCSAHKTLMQLLSHNRRFHYSPSFFSRQSSRPAALAARCASPADLTGRVGTWTESTWQLLRLPASLFDNKLLKCSAITG